MRSKKIVGALGALLLTACQHAAEPEPVGVPARAQAPCEVTARARLGVAEGAFACRGALQPGGGGWIAGARASAQEPYALLALGARGELTRSLPTEHRGERLLLRPLAAGVLAVSWSDRLRVSAHDGALDPLSDRLEEGLPERRARFYAVDAAASPDGAVVVAATGFGVEAWRLGARGERLWRGPLLRHPELPTCDQVQIEPDGEGWRLRLRCRGARPQPPRLRGGQVELSDFDFRVKESSTYEITAWYDAALRAQRAQVEEASPSAPSPRYALRQAAAQGLPHGEGQRLHVLDAWPQGDQGELVALLCVGDDATTTATLEAITARCAPSPPPPSPPAP